MYNTLLHYIAQVSHEWTDYGHVQNMYSDGHEIASHSISHRFCFVCFQFQHGFFSSISFFIEMWYRFCLDLLLFSISLKHLCSQFWRAILQEEVVERDGRSKVGDLEYCEYVIS